MTCMLVVGARAADTMAAIFAAAVGAETVFVERTRSGGRSILEAIESAKLFPSSHTARDVHDGLHAHPRALGVTMRMETRGTGISIGVGRVYGAIAAPASAARRAAACRLTSRASWAVRPAVPVGGRCPRGPI